MEAKLNERPGGIRESFDSWLMWGLPRLKEMSLSLGESVKEFSWKKLISSSTVSIGHTANSHITLCTWESLAGTVQLPKSTLPGSVHWKISSKPEVQSNS